MERWKRVEGGRAGGRRGVRRCLRIVRVEGVPKTIEGD